MRHYEHWHGSNHSQTPSFIYVMEEELRGLQPGVYTPEIKGFSYKLRLEPKPGGKTILRYNDTEVIIDREDKIRLTTDGQIGVVKGPNYYKDALRKAIARSKLPQRLLVYSDQEICADYGENLRVLNLGNKWKELRVARSKEGKMVVLYEDHYDRTTAKYLQFVVREQYKHDEIVYAAIAGIVSKFPQTPSGAFSKALREQWEPWVQSAAQQYYSAQTPVAQPV